MNRLDLLERLFKALADQTRLRILSLLAGGEVCVCEIHESLGIPQPKTSRHLAYLKRTGLVADRKNGHWVYYRLSDPADDLVRTMLSAVTHCLTHVETTDRDRRRLTRATERTAGPRGEKGRWEIEKLSRCYGCSTSSSASRRRRSRESPTSGL